MLKLRYIRDIVEKFSNNKYDMFREMYISFCKHGWYFYT